MKSSFTRSAMLALYMTCSLTSCGGRTANPVMVQQYGDEKKSCKALESEMLSIQQRITELLPETDKAGKNTALGVTGFFLIVPLFFMDLSHAEQEEVNAYRDRYNHLAAIAADKDCDIDTRPIEEAKPSPSTQEPQSSSDAEPQEHPSQHVVTGGPNKP